MRDIAHCAQAAPQRTGGRWRSLRHPTGTTRWASVAQHSAAVQHSAVQWAAAACSACTPRQGWRSRGSSSPEASLPSACHPAWSIHIASIAAWRAKCGTTNERGEGGSDAGRDLLCGAHVIVEPAGRVCRQRRLYALRSAAAHGHCVQDAVYATQHALCTTFSYTWCHTPCTIHHLSSHVTAD